jgi:RNA polymerase sigma-70 factor (ECF subfamily)
MPPQPERDDADDLALIARWQRGEERAASVLVARHAPALSRFVTALGERAEAEEVVQDTFVRAFGSLDAFRWESAFRTWLFTIARRLVLDRRRAGKRGRELVNVEDVDLVSAHDALDGMVATETEEQVRRAVGRLTPTQREVFLLRVNEGLSYRDIAEIVGSTEGAARVHYHNAMRAVKESIHA